MDSAMMFVHVELFTGSSLWSNTYFWHFQETKQYCLQVIKHTNAAEMLHDYVLCKFTNDTDNNW